MNIDNENGFPLIEADRKIKHYVQTFSANVHHFYIYGAIENDLSMYSDLLNVLKTAPESDTVMIYINSEGGILRMALQIANSMIASDAKVITSLDGDAISAATLIFLAGDEYIINPNCSFMIHNYSTVLGGKGHELVSQISHTGSTVDKIMRFFYEKILTEEEFDDVCNGRDVWMDSEELTERLSSGFQKEVHNESESVSEMVEPTKTQRKTKKKRVTKKAARKPLKE